MKKFTNLLIVASLALAGAVMAQQPTPEESQPPGKKPGPEKKQPAEVKPAPPRAPKSEAPAVKEPAAKEHAVKEPVAKEPPAITKPDRKGPKSEAPAAKEPATTKPDKKDIEVCRGSGNKNRKAAASATTAPKKDQAAQHPKDMKAPGANPKHIAHCDPGYDGSDLYPSGGQDNGDPGGSGNDRAGSQCYPGSGSDGQRGSIGCANQPDDGPS